MAPSGERPAKRTDNGHSLDEARLTCPDRGARGKQRKLRPAYVSRRPIAQRAGCCRQSVSERAVPGGLLDVTFFRPTSVRKGACDAASLRRVGKQRSLLRQGQACASAAHREQVAIPARREVGQPNSTNLAQHLGMLPDVVERLAAEVAQDVPNRHAGADLAVGVHQAGGLARTAGTDFGLPFVGDPRHTP